MSFTSNSQSFFYLYILETFKEREVYFLVLKYHIFVEQHSRMYIKVLNQKLLMSRKKPVP